MSKKYLYDHGLPFSEKLGENIQDLVTRVKKGKAAMIIIDGGVGEGKTTLAVEIADYINKHYEQEQIALIYKKHPQLATGGEAFLKQLRECYILLLPVIAYDEAGDFNRRGSLTRFNAMLNRTFETYRAFKIIVILCLPSFWVLDNDLFFKGIPRLLLHLDSRSDQYGNFRGYSLYRMMYIRDRMQKLVVKTFAYDLVEPNFQGHFLDLEPERAKQLDKISTEGKLKSLQKAEVKIEGLMGYGELAHKLGRSIVWCRMAVGKLKLKPKRVISKAKYFDDTVLNRLADYLDEVGNSKR